VGPSRGQGSWCNNRHEQPPVANNPCNQPGAQQPRSHTPGERWGIEPRYLVEGVVPGPSTSSTKGPSCLSSTQLIETAQQLPHAPTKAAARPPVSRLEGGVGWLRHWGSVWEQWGWVFLGQGRGRETNILVHCTIKQVYFIIILFNVFK